MSFSFLFQPQLIKSKHVRSHNTAAEDYSVVHYRQLYIQTTRWHHWHVFLIGRDLSKLPLTIYMISNTKSCRCVDCFYTLTSCYWAASEEEDVNIYCCRPTGWVCGEPESCRTSHWGGRRADGSLQDKRRHGYLLEVNMMLLHESMFLLQVCLVKC